MSKAINSPTARLLRSSRLFSLPPPLPAAALEAVTSSGILRSSDTATLPYPTHQAISTPPSSRHRGDWGLKRPLPNRSIPKSNAHLRIKAIDTLNHITDFSSAANHTQTVEKWRDMNIPLSMAQRRDNISRTSRATPVSAFEDNVDNTAFASSSLAAKDLDSFEISAERAMLMRGLPSTQDRQRWKTEGPWVNGLTEQEFQHFVAKTVRSNKTGFLKFVEQVKINQKKQHVLSIMRDEGLLNDQDPKTLDMELEAQSKLGKHELNDYIKELRDNNSGLSSELSHLVRQYFDLPAFPMPSSQSARSDTNRLLASVLSSEDTSSENPPATHPSAGLSYIRTKAYMANHPQYGPQASHEPVQARVVKPRAGADRTAYLGVGGFIAENSSHATFKINVAKENMSPEQRYVYELSQIDPDTYGGGKVWVNPTRAHVDEKGYIQLTVERADEQAVGVKTGNPIEAPALQSLPRYTGRMDERLDARPPPGSRGNANYGRALPDERAPRRGARGFDSAELSNARGEKEAEYDQVKVIEELARQHLAPERK